MLFGYFHQSISMYLLDLKTEFVSYTHSILRQKNLHFGIYIYIFHIGVLSEHG